MAACTTVLAPSRRVRVCCQALCCSFLLHFSGSGVDAPRAWNLNWHARVTGAGFHGSNQNSIANDQVRRHSANNQTVVAGIGHVEPGMLIFLFMLRDSLPHGEVWKAFFSGSHGQNSSWMAFAHCVNDEKCKNDEVLTTLGIVLVPTVPSAYTDDLLEVEWQLIRIAANASKKHKGMQKFIFLSESTLPLWPIRKMMEVLLKTGESDLCGNAADRAAKNQIQFVSLKGLSRQSRKNASSEFSVGFVKHSQWMVLNRADANMFLEVQRHQGPFGNRNWKFPKMGSNGRANLSELVSVAKIPFATDEAAAHFVLGLYEEGLKHLWKRSKCRTGLKWPTWPTSHPVHPLSFTHPTEAIRNVWKKPDGDLLFFRKFGRDAHTEEFLQHI